MSSTLEKPLLDARVYDQIILSNGIVATMIHDGSLNRSSCAFAVKVGASSDPIQYPGLAHFTEHMLFLGTDKYPKESHYKDFLNKHGGTSNASTSMETTVYNFDVNYNYFSEALDIFSQFFISPLFDMNSTSRELRAVDSEDSKNRINDSRRTLQILKTLIQPSCTYSKYSTGNNATLCLGDPDVHYAAVREEMKLFYERHYKKAKLGVCLVGPQHIDELKELAVTYFSPIASSTTAIIGSNEESTPNPSDKSPSYPLVNGGGYIVRINPIKELNDISLVWSLPPTRNLYRNNPCKMASFLLGNEGKGSAYASLQEKGWITSLSSGIRTSFEDFSLFEVSMSLTPEGFQNWNSVVAVIYAFIDVLRDLTDMQIESYWKEITTCNALFFKYKQKASPRDTCADIASNTLFYSPDHVISAGYIYETNFNISSFRNMLNSLLPQSSVCIIRNKEYAQWIAPTDVVFGETGKYCNQEQETPGVSANRVEPWYGVHFHQEKITEENVNSWMLEKDAHKLKLFPPEENLFVPYELMESSHQDDDHTTPTSNTHVSSEGNRLKELMQNPILLLDDVDGANGNNISPLLSHTGKSNKLWWSEDLLFRYPRSVIYVLFYPTVYTASTLTCGVAELNSMLSSLHSHLLAVKRYPAEIAGLKTSVSWTFRGCHVSVSGFTPRIPLLFRDVVNDMLSAAIYDSPLACQIFDNIKEKRIRSLKSWYNERPDEQALDILTTILQKHYWLPEDKLNELSNITLDTIKQNLCQMKHHNALLYAHGSISKDEAIQLGEDLMRNEIMDTISSDTLNHKHIGMGMLLPSGDNSFLLKPFNQSDENSSFVSHFQAGDSFYSPKIAAALLMLHQYMKEPIFTNLRTKQQLGYIVSLSHETYGVGRCRYGGLTITILSKRYNPIYVQEAVAQFIKSQESVFNELSVDEFAKRIEVVISLLQEPPQSYLTEAARNWNCILHDLPFDFKEKTIIELKNMAINDLKYAAEKWIFDSTLRRSVNIMICSDSKMGELIPSHDFSTLQNIKEFCNSEMRQMDV